MSDFRKKLGSFPKVCFFRTATEEHAQRMQDI
jgi:hypothetical protein